MSTSSSGLLVLDEALARVGGDRELLVEVAGLFLADYPNQTAMIRKSIETQDAALLAGAAHKIKGGASTFGAPSVVQAAFALEKAGKANDFSTVPGLFQELNALLGALRSELSGL